ncbi:stressosome-associated protein Prli42 [Cohnella hongkongensis]|uniref:Stressosome-associated protein Prli42 n=1 Tax=Cohnella hongkongensis TaxID=178337 RepID=A0ABV9FEH8_9BACL
MNRRWFKIVIYVTLFAMVVTTLLMGVSLLQ